MSRRIPRNVLPLAFAIMLVCLLLPANAMSAQKPPAKYEPVKIASGVKGTPGTVAWSADGSRIAYIARKAHIYDISGKHRSSLKISDPYFLNWSGENQLLVLHGGGQFAIVNTVTGESRDIEMPEGAVGVYPAWDDNLIVLTEWSKEISIGVDVHHVLYLLDLESGSLKDVYVASRIIPRRYSGSEYLRGWLSEGPAPASGEALLLDFIVPPNAPPYVKAITVDPFTGRTEEILPHYREDRFGAWGGWSVLGRKAAIVDDKGHLRVLSLSGAISKVDDAISGSYPAYDPRGDRIYFGGYLIDEDGINRTAILPEEPESAAFFSPDGNSLAIAAGGKLWLLHGIEPPKHTVQISMDEIREKLILLRDLYSGGFLTADEYHKRLYAIIERQAEGK